MLCPLKYPKSKRIVITNGKQNVMPLVQEMLSLGGGGKELFGSIAALGALGTTAFKSVVVVPKRHMGLRTFKQEPIRKRGRRKGQLRRSVGPGVHIVIPILGGIKSTTMQKRPDSLPAFSVECEDGKHQGDVGILWHVRQHEEQLPEAPSEKREPNPRVHAQIRELDLKGLAKNIREQHRNKKLQRILQRMVVKKPIGDRIKDSWAEMVDDQTAKKEEAQVERQLKYQDDLDLYRALFLAKDDSLDNFVRVLAGSCIISAIREIGPELAVVPDQVHTHVVSNYGERFSEYGLALDGIYIHSFGRSEAQTHADELRRGPWDPDKLSGLGRISGPAVPPLQLAEEA